MLIGEVEYPRQMMEMIKIMVTAHGLEDELGIEWQDWKKRRRGRCAKETTRHISTEDRDTGL